VCVITLISRKICDTSGYLCGDGGGGGGVNLHDEAKSALISPSQTFINNRYKIHVHFKQPSRVLPPPPLVRMLYPYKRIEIVLQLFINSLMKLVDLPMLCVI
jgi:hypothetical protein